jgi:hypothetical protein
VRNRHRAMCGRGRNVNPFRYNARRLRSRNVHLTNLGLAHIRHNSVGASLDLESVDTGAVLLPKDLLKLFRGPTVVKQFTVPVSLAGVKSDAVADAPRSER